MSSAAGQFGLPSEFVLGARAGIQVMRLTMAFASLLALTWPAETAAECLPRPDDSAWTTQQLLQRLELVYQHQLENPALPDPEIINTEYDLARLRARILENILPGSDASLRVYAVVNDRYARSKPEEILVTEGALLCLLDPFTSVLLSDGITHHYALVEGIDWAAKIARIADSWARYSFLIGSDLPEDMRGWLEGQPTGAVTIVVPLKTFALFLVGAVVDENESFAPRVAAVHDLDHDADDLIALGLSLVSEQDLSSFDRAVPYLQRAVAAATSEATKRQARIQLAYVCLIGMIARLNDGQRTDVDRFGNMLHDLLNRGDVSFEEMSAEQLTHIGERYFQVSQFRESKLYLSKSEHYLNLAIQRDANYADAFLARAETLFKAGKPEKALADAREAYRLNTAQIRLVIRTPGDDFVDQFYKFSPGVSIVSELSSRRWRLLNLLAAIYGEAERHEDKLAVVQEATRLAPIDPTGWLLTAEAQYALGDTLKARQSAQHALDLATDPGKRAIIAARLRKIFIAVP